jgi:hypothetical protein
MFISALGLLRVAIVSIPCFIPCVETALALFYANAVPHWFFHFETLRKVAFLIQKASEKPAEMSGTSDNQPGGMA